MVIKVYDYDDRPLEIELPDKEIDFIHVTVLSGDETGYVVFTDKTRVEFDASDCRLMGYYDGSYLVTGDDIDKWIKFEPSGERTISYERQEKFELED